MASGSTSSGRDHVAERLRRAASTLADDTHALAGEIRKAFNMVKDIAVDLEKDNQSQQVKELETLVARLSESSGDCIRHATAIRTVGNEYQPNSEFTDFEKLLDEEFTKLKAMPSQNDRLIRQFQEAVWNVHHPGQPLPGEEQEDIVMMSTQSNLLNVKCPLTGKMITDLVEPVRSTDCKHIYEKKAVMDYIPRNGSKIKCCIAGCPKILQAQKLICDPFLLAEIEELRSMNQQTEQANDVEDFTALDEED